MGSFAHMTLRIKNVLHNTKGIESLARVREGFEKCVEGRRGDWGCFFNTSLYVSDLNLQSCPPCGATWIATRPLWGSGILENKIWIVRRDKYMIYVPPWKLFLLREKCQYEIQIHSRVLALLEIFWKSAISVQSGDQNLVGFLKFQPNSESIDLRLRLIVHCMQCTKTLLTVHSQCAKTLLTVHCLSNYMF